MKLKLPEGIYYRAAACAERADIPTSEWCGMACKQYGNSDGLSVVASDELGDVATTVATIDGTWFAAHARRAITAAVDRVEAANARNPHWFSMGSDSARVVELSFKGQKVCA